MLQSILENFQDGARRYDECPNFKNSIDMLSKGIGSHAVLDSALRENKRLLENIKLSGYNLELAETEIKVLKETLDKKDKHLKKLIDDKIDAGMRRASEVSTLTAAVTERDRILGLQQGRIGAMTDALKEAVRVLTFTGEFIFEKGLADEFDKVAVQRGWTPNSAEGDNVTPADGSGLKHDRKLSRHNHRFNN